MLFALFLAVCLSDGEKTPSKEENTIEPNSTSFPTSTPLPKRTPTRRTRTKSNGGSSSCAGDKCSKDRPL